LKKIVFFTVFSLYCHYSWSQGEIDTQEKILFQNEKSISLILNSNGYGARFLFGRRIAYLTKNTYDVEFAFIKDPKEVKVTSDNTLYTTSRKFVFGKYNSFMNIRPSYGFQREVFSREDKGSIAIKYYYALGPSFGITKPIYYTFNVKDSVINNWLYYSQVDGKFEYYYNPDRINIAGHAGTFKGMKELKLYLGIHAKAGVTFEYSSSNRLINALEVGMVFDAFTKEIPIMYNEYNHQFFFTLFAAYRFGWVSAVKYKTPKITTEGKRQSD
jgi:hypothetical protein